MMFRTNGSVGFNTRWGKTLGIYPRGDDIPAVEWGGGRGHPVGQLIRRHCSSAGINAQVFTIWCQELRRSLSDEQWNHLIESSGLIHISHRRVHVVEGPDLLSVCDCSATGFHYQWAVLLTRCETTLLWSLVCVCACLCSFVQTVYMSSSSWVNDMFSVEAC